uniref:Uncharacterized protein n=1 Tax=Acrobeloides nanus TaxID=290746 RepID=A0A914CX62_9BILA
MILVLFSPKSATFTEESINFISNNISILSDRRNQISEAVFIKSQDHNHGDNDNKNALLFHTWFEDKKR